eukprot:8164919-Karenia_brevis.AAC.1
MQEGARPYIVGLEHSVTCVDSVQSGAGRDQHLHMAPCTRSYETCRRDPKVGTPTSSRFPRQNLFHGASLLTVLEH